MLEVDKLRRYTASEIVSELRIFRTKEKLRQAIRDFGFPPGALLTPNARSWSAAEIEDWCASRPTDTKPAATGNDPTAAFALARVRKAELKQAKAAPSVIAADRGAAG